MISILFAFLKHEKDTILVFFFMKICLKKLLEFGCMHERKIFFFLRKEINLEIFFEIF